MGTATAHGRIGVLISLFWTVFAPGGPGYALDPGRSITQYIRTSWTSTDGLPQNVVLSLLQTRDGYLWAGTQEGLVRFDGLEFQVFDRSTTHLMTNTSVQALLEDAEGALWIGTEGGGVLRLNAGTWSAFRSDSGLPSEIVHALLLDRQGTVWAGTYEGVGRWDGKRWISYPIGEDGKNYRVRCLLEDRQGRIWAGTEGGGIYRFEDGRFRPFSLSRLLPDGRIRCLAQSPSGDLTVGMDGGGMAVLRGERWTFFREADGLPNDRVFALLWDRDGCLWVATEGGGVGRLSSGRWSRFTSREGLGGDLVYSLFEDREGSLWVGLFGGGLCQLREGRWTTITTAEGLAANNVWCVLASPDGEVWAGTEEGLCRLRNGRWTLYSEGKGLPFKRVRSLCRGRSGALYVGTGGGGLGRLEHGRWTTLSPPGGMPNTRVYAVLEDRRGALWVGTYGGGVLRLEGGKWTTFTTADGLPSDRVRALLEDRQGTIWAGTYGGGLGRWSGGKWTAVTEKDGLPGDLVLCLSLDSRGRIWVGTSGNGLGMLDERGWHRFTMASGLSDNKAFAILEDRRGHLWFSSNKGVCEVPLSDLEEYAAGRISAVRSKLHGASEGLIGRECNGGSQPAGFRTPDGRLWFPTPAGLAIMDPSWTPRNLTPPRAVVHQVIVNGRPLGTRGSPSAPVGRGEVQIRYSGISLSAPKAVRFRYRLEPYDPAWVEASTRREAFYTNLSPGTYRFRLTAAGEDRGTAVEAVVAFTLLPPFWRTPLFFFLIFLLVLAVGTGLYLLSLHNIRRRAARLEALVAERTAQLEEANQALERIAVRDGLTGLYNRRWLNETLDREWRRGIRSGHPLSILIVDADGFKSINDACGHQEGDAVLQAVAAVLREVLQRSTDFVARYGGDEFVAVLEGLDREGALLMAEEVRSRVASACRASRDASIPRDITVSVGVSTAIPAAGYRFEDLLRSADDALLEAKRQGRNRICAGTFAPAKNAP